MFVWGYAPPFYYYARQHGDIRPASRFIIPQASLSGFVPGNPDSFAGDPQVTVNAPTSGRLLATGGARPRVPQAAGAARGNAATR